MLETLAAISNPNSSTAFSRIYGWGLIKLDLKTPNLQELRIMFKEFHPKYRHLGIDEYDRDGTKIHQSYLKYLTKNNFLFQSLLANV